MILLREGASGGESWYCLPYLCLFEFLLAPLTNSAPETYLVGDWLEQDRGLIGISKVHLIFETLDDYVPMAFTTLLLVLIAGTSLVYYLTSASTRSVPKGTRLPPGPPGRPVVGNLLEIPPKHSWLRFKEWSDQYGPVMRLNIGGKEHYILSSDKAANDLLRERGTIYSSREQMPAAVNLLSGNLRPLFYPYNGSFM